MSIHCEEICMIIRQQWRLDVVFVGEAKEKQQKSMWQERCFVRVDILLMISPSCFFICGCEISRKKLSLSRSVPPEVWSARMNVHYLRTSEHANEFLTLSSLVRIVFTACLRFSPSSSHFLSLSVSYLILYSLVFLLLLRLLFDRPQLSNKLATSNKLLLFFVLY